MTTELTGRALDAAVAERVMGWLDGRVSHPDKWAKTFDGRQRPWPIWVDEAGRHISEDYFGPSTDIAAAWQVVEVMKAEGYVCDIGTSLPDSNNGGKVSVFFWYPRGERAHAISLADTAPEAICRAALQALT